MARKWVNIGDTAAAEKIEKLRQSREDRRTAIRKRLVDRRNRITRSRHFTLTPRGAPTADLFIKPFIIFLDGKLTDKPNPPPGDLGELIRQLPSDELAQIIIKPLLHAVFARWKGYDKRSARMLLAKRMGQHLHDMLVRRRVLEGGYPEFLAKQKKRRRRKQGDPPRRAGRPRKIDLRSFKYDNWTPSDWVHAGDWMLDCALALPYFDTDARGLPIVALKYKPHVDAVYAALLLRDQFPQLQPPPDWSGWYSAYPDGSRVAFVRDWRPQTRIAIERAFNEREKIYGVDAAEEALVRIAATGAYEGVHTPASIAAEAALQVHTSAAQYEVVPGTFVQQHVAGINRLQKVPFKINTLIRDLVEQYAVDVLARTGKKRLNDIWMVQHDVNVATMLGDQEFYNGYCCDRRGRIYSVSYFGFERQDHVRAMFQFARGRKLGALNAGRSTRVTASSERLGLAGVGGFTDLEMLEVHCANMFGEDKLPWAGRLDWLNAKWVPGKTNRDMIREIAAKPFSTFDLWSKADKPFQFVAACVELAQAESNPNFETHLPVQFDGSANGIQHLAWIARDRSAAELTNLLGLDPTRGPRDPYLEVGADVALKLAAANDPVADYWKKIFAAINDPEERRKFFKAGVMTYPYGVTAKGMARQVGAAFRKRFGEKALKGAPKYLAGLIEQSINEMLPKAAEVRDYISGLAWHCGLRSGDLAQLNFEGFLHWISPTGFPVENRYQPVKKDEETLSDGTRVKVVNSVRGEIDANKAKRSAAPNFIHSLDASHLIRTVLAATEAGINDIAVVHDCFAVPAGDAAQFSRIIRREMYLMYKHQDWLGRLHAANNIEGMPPPKFGRLPEEQTLDNEYAFN